MKRILLILLCAALLMPLPLTVYAESGVSRANELYPVSVWENLDGGRREIIRTYELGDDERPENISREPFTRDGWLYELAEITKRETANADARNHSERVTVDTATNEMAAIIALLEPSMDYKSDDGYSGVLQLDISSIKVESAGTKSSSFAVTATREYPHLSSNDSSLIPKTITENSRTLELSGIDWRVQNYTTIDYEKIPDAYTAVATYSGTGWRTITVGYVTTAEYSGSVSKILSGRTVYSAYFIGSPAQTETENEAETNPSQTEPPSEAPDAIPGITETEQPIETEKPIEEVPPSETEPEKGQGSDSNDYMTLLSANLPVILAVLTGIIILGLVLLAVLKKPAKKSIPIKKRRKPINDEEID